MGRVGEWVSGRRAETHAFRSYPAARADPRTGSSANSVSFFTRNIGSCLRVHVIVMGVEEVVG